MRASSVKKLGATLGPRTSEQAGAQTIVLLLVVFFLGIAVSAFLFYATSKHGSAAASGETNGPPAIALSESTKAVLSRLDAPVELRFYALLDTASVAASVTAFASRVDQLLSAYQQQAGGKIKLAKINSQANADASAAVADGVTAFNLDAGVVAYLGITLELNGKKETLPHLSPEWEQALEIDLTRAIVRLLDATRFVAPLTALPQAFSNTVQEVKALIPDASEVPLEGGKQLLRAAALKDYTAAVKEMQAQVAEAEQHLSQTMNGGTEAEQQAARQHLLQVQTEQNEKLRDIAAKSKAQMDAFQQLKAAPR